MNRVDSIAIVRESETRLKTAFDNILSNYLHARRKPFGREHPLWRVFEELAEHFKEYVSNRPTLEIKWSVGKGNWAGVPWIAFLDSRETISTQNGVFPAYFFREDLAGVYLMLNQGIGAFKEKHGTPESRRIVRERAEQLRHDSLPLHVLEESGFSLNNKIHLYRDRGLEKDYEASVVGYKFYRRDEIPEDGRLLNDLDQLLRVYDEYLKRQPFRELETPALNVMPGPPHEDFRIESAIHEVISYIADRGFVYEPWQIAQYVTAIRTKPFVILAGITGTGKSKLPALVAEATGGESKLVPVRPDWTDSADVLGYTDLEGNFRPGPVLELAHSAAANSDQFFTCIIDEMNLARVEQYFAEVLSRIEDRRPQSNGGYRTGPLIRQVAKEADAEWGEVVIPENLAIVGTVNMDESTHPFSRKVLDRAFTIELSDVNLAQWNANGERVRPVATWPVASWHPIKIQLSELSKPDDQQLAEISRAIAALQAVNILLTPAQLQVGYRTRDEVAFYLLHAQQIADAFIDHEGNAVDPLDLALQMKVLPRIAGDSNAIKRAVFGLLGWATTGVPLESPDEVNSILDSWESAERPSSLPNSEYPRLAARLCLMWQRLEVDGYTSYWL
jgi:hypothetical protein